MPLLHIVTMARLTCKPSLSKYYMTMIISKINLKHLLIVICNHFPLLSVTNVIYLKCILSKIMNDLDLGVEYLTYFIMKFGEKSPHM